MLKQQIPQPVHAAAAQHACGVFLSMQQSVKVLNMWCPCREPGHDDSTAGSGSAPGGTDQGVAGSKAEGLEDAAAYPIQVGQLCVV